MVPLDAGYKDDQWASDWAVRDAMLLPKPKVCRHPSGLRVVVLSKILEKLYRKMLLLIGQDHAKAWGMFRRGRRAGSRGRREHRVGLRLGRAAGDIEKTGCLRAHG